ncbi:hypothetical protein [Kamptonema sp. UHCC 0994]|uniref:hypothetical protein n=1 Tax=Kamptonema sp. UHCC 0994 TaxID=3031329 RepID=UPI0023BA7FEC|nr:hypothetical protein [Kamptonema sp. UHCC 0994]MDF0556401.1 hypothetical protein [Kamptonema sp. UHCC 0994]
MRIETLKSTLLSEIKELEESLHIIENRVKEGATLGSHTNVDTARINNLIGKYQLLTEIMAANETKEQ